MTDQQTTVLYVLTTLAQSCAALAAFVGAVGVFRIQMLREQRQGAEKVLRGRTHEASIFRDAAFWMPIDDIVKRLDTVRADLHLKDTDTSNESNPSLAALFAAFKALDVWRVSEVPFKRTRGALLLLEGWNLAVITVALVGFNHVSALAVAPLFACALVFVAVITALVPLGCVWVWTQGAEK